MKTYSAHVQLNSGSGYMLGGGEFTGTQAEATAQAVRRYLELVNRDRNPFGRCALLRNPNEPLHVLLIDGRARGPELIAATGFCNVWNEDATNAYESCEPEYESVRWQEFGTVLID